MVTRCWIHGMMQHRDSNWYLKVLHKLSRNICQVNVCCKVTMFTCALMLSLEWTALYVHFVLCVQTEMLVVGTGCLHAAHLGGFRYDPPLSQGYGSGRSHGSGWNSHGNHRHHSQLSAGQTVPERLHHIPSGQQALLSYPLFFFVWVFGYSSKLLK